jgi:hypothetical protein
MTGQQSERVPTALRGHYDAITALTDQFCQARLNTEYRDVCRRMAGRHWPNAEQGGSRRRWPAAVRAPNAARASKRLAFSAIAPGTVAPAYLPGGETAMSSRPMRSTCSQLPNGRRGGQGAHPRQDHRRREHIWPDRFSSSANEPAARLGWESLIPTIDDRTRTRSTDHTITNHDQHPPSGYTERGTLPPRRAPQGRYLRIHP